VPAAPIAPVIALQQGAPRRVLRSTGLAMPVSAALEHVLPGLSETAAIDTFNAIAHQWLGHIVRVAKRVVLGMISWQTCVFVSKKEVDKIATQRALPSLFNRSRWRQRRPRRLGSLVRA